MAFFIDFVRGGMLSKEIHRIVEEHEWSSLRPFWEKEGRTPSGMGFISMILIGDYNTGILQLKNQRQHEADFVLGFFALCDIGWRPQDWSPELGKLVYQSYCECRTASVAMLKMNVDGVGCQAGAALAAVMAKHVWNQRSEWALQLLEEQNTSHKLKRTKKFFFV